MDFASAFPQDPNPFFGGSGYYDSTPMGPPQQPPQQQQQQGRPSGQGQATFAGALPTPQVAEQPVIYGGTGAPTMPHFQQNFADMGEERRGEGRGKQQQYKKAAYLALCFLMAIAIDRIVGLYLSEYLATAGFDPTREAVTWVMYPLAILVAMWLVLRS